MTDEAIGAAGVADVIGSGLAGRRSPIRKRRSGRGRCDLAAAMTASRILTETLDAYAERAVAGRDDMVEIVERRFRRRRARRIGSATAALAVFAVVTAVFALNIVEGTATRVPPSATRLLNGWRIPNSAAPVRSSWPESLHIGLSGRYKRPGRCTMRFIERRSLAGPSNRSLRSRTSPIRTRHGF